MDARRARGFAVAVALLLFVGCGLVANNDSIADFPTDALLPDGSTDNGQPTRIPRVEYDSGSDSDEQNHDDADASQPPGTGGAEAGEGSGGMAGAEATGGAGGSSAGVGGAGDTGGAAGCPPLDPPHPDPPKLDLAKVTWLHQNVSQWPVKVKLDSVTFKDSNICMNHNIATKDWPTAEVGGATVVGNPWVFIYKNDRWYGATWEWLRAPGQTCKSRKAVAGDHIKASPFDAASCWRPTSGEVLYFMVSGFARGGLSNRQERSDAVRVVWP